MSPLEIAAVVFSILGVWLTTRRNLLSWPTGILSCGLYAAVFLRTRLYSDVLLQCVYVAVCAYGWWHWKRGVQQEGAVRVERLSFSGWKLGILVGTVGSLLLGGLMARYTNAAIPYMDSTLTSFSLVAQYWSTRKYVANWWMWIAVDVAATGVYFYKHLYLTSGLYAAFVVLAILGLRAWTQALKQETNPTPIPVS